MDPAVASIVVALVSAALGGWAVVRGERIKAGSQNRAADTASLAAATANVSAQTTLLVNGLQTQVKTMDAQIAARDSTIEDLREKWLECEAGRLEDRKEIGRQSAEIAGLSEAVSYLRKQVTEIGKRR